MVKLTDYENVSNQPITPTRGISRSSPTSPAADAEVWLACRGDAEAWRGTERCEGLRGCEFQERMKHKPSITSIPKIHPSAFCNLAICVPVLKSSTNVGLQRTVASTCAPSIHTAPTCEAVSWIHSRLSDATSYPVTLLVKLQPATKIESSAESARACGKKYARCGVLSNDCVNFVVTSTMRMSSWHATMSLLGLW
jgi:hypothetical protein